MTQQPPTNRRWYGHPFVIGLLAILLFADLLSISSDVWTHSTIKHDFLALPITRSTAHGRPILGTPLRTDGGIEWRWPTDADYVPPLRGLVDDGLYGVFVFRDITRDSGLYHLTRRTERFSVLADELSAQDEQALLNAILIAIEREPSYGPSLYFVPDMIRAGVRTRTFPIYSGYARNTLAAFVALVFIIYCTRGRPWEWFRDPRLGIDGRYSLRTRRQRRGQCLSCGYDLTGLEANRCPECGLECGVPGSAESGPMA